MNENLAQIYAMLLSDGSVYFDKSKRTYCIQFTNTVTALLDYFAKLVVCEFGQRKFSYNRCGSATSIRFFSVPIAKQLLAHAKTFRTLRFEDGTYPSCVIPSPILSSQKLASAFLRAYCSCDGCITSDASHPHGVVEVACYNPNLRVQLACCFESVGIRVSRSKRGVRIYDRASFSLFSSEIRFLDESSVSDSNSKNFGLKKNSVLDSCFP